MRITSIVAAFALLACPVLAQPAQPLRPTTQPAQPTAQPLQPEQPTAPRSGQPTTATVPAPADPASTHRRRTMQERFDAANTTHDGHLTLEQARAGRMNAVVRDFAAIDTARRGYVTLDDIKAHRRAVRQARKAAAPR